METTTAPNAAAATVAYGFEVAHTVALSGIVGSTAYGLARKGSDLDRLGVYVAPTRAILGTTPPAETIHVAGPDREVDVTLHEFGKFIHLASKCNPTILELLYLPDELIEVSTEAGRLLRENRSAFLSEPYVRSAYGGYALSQARKLAARGDGTFTSGTKNRTAKHARHCFRLLRNGRQLLSTGELTLRVDNPEEYFAFDTMPVEDILAQFAEEDAAFTETTSVLPQNPDRDLINEILLAVRHEFYDLAA